MLGNRIRWFRKRWNLTTNELADRADIHPATLQLIETGKVRPLPVEVERLADTLCISADWLSTGNGEPIGLDRMTPDEQIRAQSGRGTEGLPGFVVTPGGPWFRNDSGRWMVMNEVGTK